MVFARTSKAASRLSEQVRKKEFQKKYLAMCDGKMEKEKDIFQDFLQKNERTNTSKVVEENAKNAKEAILDYEVVSYNEKTNLSLVRVNLHTGRHHQIRVQLSSRGHSIYRRPKIRNKRKRKTNLFVGLFFRNCSSCHQGKNGVYLFTTKNRLMENLRRCRRAFFVKCSS